MAENSSHRDQAERQIRDTCHDSMVDEEEEIGLLVL